jgi:hypothetical protein
MPANQYMQPFFDALSQGVQVAQSLRQAALQQQYLQQEREAQQQRQKLAQQEFDAQQQAALSEQLAKGARPVGPDGTVDGATASQPPASQPPAPQPSQPAPRQAPPPASTTPPSGPASTLGPWSSDASPKGAYYDLTGALQQAGGGASSLPYSPSPDAANAFQATSGDFSKAPVLNGTPAPASNAPQSSPAASSPQNTPSSSAPSAPARRKADPSRTFTVAGVQLEAPTIQEQLDRTIAQKKGLEDADRVSISDKLADAIGLPHGTKLSPEHLAGVGALAHWLNPPEGQPGDGKTWKDVENKETGEFNRVFSDSHGNPTKIISLGKLGGGRAAGEGGAEKTLTPDAQMTAGNKALDTYHKFEAQEQQLRQTLDRTDQALKLGGAYTVKVDDKGNSTLVKVAKDKDGTAPDPATILDDLRTTRTSTGNALRSALNNKYDAGDHYSVITNGKPATWGTSKAQAQQDLEARLGGGGATPKAAAPTAPTAAAATTPKAAGGLPPAAAKLLQPGKITTFANGQRWKLDAQGKPVQVGQ